jgi:hypothetical protein
MDSRTLSLLADQAELEVEAALRREKEGELQLKLLHSDTKAKRDTLRVLRKEICAARLVRNIRIPRVFGRSLCVYEWNFCQEFLG